MYVHWYRLPKVSSMSLKEGKSIRYGPVADVAVAVTPSFHTYAFFLTIVVGLPLPPPSSLVVVSLVSLPKLSKAEVTVVCGTAALGEPSTVNLSCWVAWMSQTAMGLLWSTSLTSMPSQLPQPTLLGEPATPVGGQVAV